MRSQFVLGMLCVPALALLAVPAATRAATLRIVAWNIEDDINGATTPLPGYNTVLQGIGQETLGADGAQPLDIMSLEETTSNASSVDPMVASLNADYSAAKYETTDATYDPSQIFQATESGSPPDAADGNGPNSIIWNANTVTLLAAVGINPTTGSLGSSSGEYRQVARYEFQPVGSTTPFYVYVSHAKSGTGSSNASDRAKEAAIVTSNISTLPSGSTVLVMGDLNGSYPEAQFTTYSAAGFTDPAGFPSGAQFYSESATDLRYRDDYQLAGSNVLNGTGALSYVAGSLNNLGDNGTTATYGTVNSPSTTGGTNTALAYMTTANGYAVTQAQILAAETTASDHLPVVADYSFSVPEPTSWGLLACGGASLLVRRRRLQASRAN